MRPRPETIRLGAREWPVRPLTLRQVQEIEPILMSSTAETKGNVTAALAIVAIALGRDHADAAALPGDIEATAPEIGAAMALYGKKVILLVEHGVTLPSNLQGLYRCDFAGDKLEYDSTMKLLKTFSQFR